jgi:hypothetical protein
VEIHEYLVLKHDGKTEHFPVLNGDIAQARIRASLCQRPGDSLVAVMDDAYVQLRPDIAAEKSSQT